MQKKEAILKNTVIENVCSCLHDTLKDIEEQDFFTASRLARYHSFSVYEYNDEINVDYSITVYPDDPEKLFRWYTGTAFIFKALQLQTNTVKLKAECHPVDLHSVFDSYWDKILKDFRQTEKPKEPERGSSVFDWLDYYHDMKNAGHQITFEQLAEKSKYSKNYFKQEHGRYKSERGID